MFAGADLSVSRGRPVRPDPYCSFILFSYSLVTFFYLFSVIARTLKNQLREEMRNEISKKYSNSAFLDLIFCFLKPIFFCSSR